MINEYNFKTKFIKIWVQRKPAQVYESQSLDFDKFLVKVGIAQMGIFSNQAEFDEIDQLCSVSSFFPTTRHLSLNTI